MCELSFAIGICFGILIGILVNIVMDKWFTWKTELREDHEKKN